MNRSKAFIILLFTLVVAGCLDPYEPPITNEQTNFLVIDGHINSTQDEVIVKIGRSLGLRDTASYPGVGGATVSVETEDGQQVTLTESSPGTYRADFNFDESAGYRLRVTLGGSAYQSDLIKTVANGPIDSLTWRADDSQLEIYANTHDNSEGDKYYRYSYDETYQYRSFYSSDWIYSNPTPMYRRPDEQIYKCWKTTPSTNIILTSTENYAENQISNFAVARIFKGDPRLWHQHSLLVRQHSIDKETYNYWSRLSKITEGVGGLFDPLPYQITGNVHSITDPDEVVLGYFDGGAVSEARVVINNYQLPPGYSGLTENQCEETYVPNADIPTLEGRNVVLTKAEYVRISIVGYYYSRPDCADCRLGGGTNVKPEFMN